MNHSLIPKGMTPDRFGDIIQQISGKLGPTAQAMDRSSVTPLANKFKERMINFMNAPTVQMTERIEAYWKTSDLPDPVNQRFSMFTDTTNTDTGWMLAFDDVSALMNQDRDFWEIATDDTDTTRGDGKFGWKVIPEGDKVEMVKLTANLEQVKVRKYGAGLNWSDEIIRFKKLVAMMQVADKFVRGYQTDKADRFYALLARSFGANIQNPTGGATVLANDIATLNDAAFELLNGLKNTLNLSLGTEILLYADARYQSRINQALSTVDQAFAGSRGSMEYRIRPVYTLNDDIAALAAPTGTTFSGMMVIPGFRNQWAQLMDVTMFNDNDITSLSFIQTAFAYYGGACLDSNQFRKVEFV